VLYDNAYYLSQVFHTFMNANPDLLIRLCEVFAGEDIPACDMADVLISRFEQWLDTSSGVTDVDHRAALRQMTIAFAELATACETTESGVHT
jgi:hypothetical protein